MTDSDVGEDSCSGAPVVVGCDFDLLLALGLGDGGHGHGHHDHHVRVVPALDDLLFHVACHGLYVLSNRGRRVVACGEWGEHKRSETCCYL